MSELVKRVGDIQLSTWLNGHPRWTKLVFGEKEISGMVPEDLHDLRFAIDRFLEHIAEYDDMRTK